ncbi:replication initiation protein (plasmid) [Carnobacterium maltaromaticum]|uniref:replication initiation protein n=1 Tax=Carnobacterium maltaromaticum TaxID=2751 RepID=UPI00344F306D
MSNEVVRYQNELNSIGFRKFNAVEMDLFFSICAKLKKQNTDTIRLSFEQLRELSNYKPTATKRFVTDLESVYNKMLQLTYTTRNGLDVDKFVLFNGFSIRASEDVPYVEISINPKLESILNEIDSNFTRFELEEFTQLKSSYSKTLYRLLKQYRSTGIYIITIEEFRRLLDIPASYRITNIDQKVLTPVKKELSKYFDNLQIVKTKAKKGNKIAQLVFTFTEKNKSKVPLDYRPSS